LLPHPARMTAIDGLLLMVFLPVYLARAAIGPPGGFCFPLFLNHFSFLAISIRASVISTFPVG